MYAYIHTYMHACIHTYIKTNTHTYIHTYLPTYLPTYVGTYINDPSKTRPPFPAHGGGGAAEVPCMIIGFQGDNKPAGGGRRGGETETIHPPPGTIPIHTYIPTYL